jgi:hypothetical protein
MALPKETIAQVTCTSTEQPRVRSVSKTNARGLQDDFIGRESELRRLSAAIHNRQSLLIWGPTDAGKTALVKKAIGELPEKRRQTCIFSSGAVSVRQLAEELVRGLYAAGDPLVREKLREGGCRKQISAARWFKDRSSGQLKAILYQAAQKSPYTFFLDHMPAATQSMARLMKEIIWRCKTPVYLLSRGCSHEEIGSAWSIYFAKEYHIHVGPVSDSSIRELLERCIRRFGLADLDLGRFRDEILRLSRQLPGCVTKMCELAAHPRYHYGDQIKVNLVHVDYLMRADPSGDKSPAQT